MPFCRFCGELITGDAERCRKCGGKAVHSKIADRWSKTYTTDNARHQPTSPLAGQDEPRSRSTSPTKRFPRPMSSPSAFDNSFANKAPTNIRPLSPQKLTRSKPASPNSQAKSGILPSLDNSSTLSKVYGSVLQPKETLAKMQCSICQVAFPPDGTIYPNLSDQSQFLCKLCFAQNGGSKGSCETCSRPVLALKAEGPFVENAGRFWHASCFKCHHCYKGIGDMPLVDVQGRPACMECFLAQSSPSPRRQSQSPRHASREQESTPPSNPGGFKINIKSRESSPAIEELEDRLGISRRDTDATQNSPFSTPTKQGNSQRLSPEQKWRGPSPERSLRYAPPSPTPLRKSDELKSLNSRLSQASLSSGSSSHLFDSDSASTGLSSAPSTPPKPTKTEIQSRAPSTDRCAECQLKIASQFICVPLRDQKKVYHEGCFKCAVCRRPFQTNSSGQTAFAVSNNEPCHATCIEKTTPKQSPVTPRKFGPTTSGVKPVGNIAKASSSSPRLESNKPGPSASASAAPRFGSIVVCPGCQVRVAPMEPKVVPGPSGSRWHASCLVCGGAELKRAKTKSAGLFGLEEDTAKQPGCGKRLDSAAKSDGEGGVWCRECMMLLPRNATEAITKQITGGRLSPTKQFYRDSPAILTRQLTGGGLSPTKQLYSRPRPKSVHEGSGRGMFLVRQMTGAKDY